MIVGPQGPAKVGRRGDSENKLQCPKRIGIISNMGKKSHKKLKDLARLQALYGEAEVPSSHSQDFHKDKARHPHAPDVGHLHVKNAKHYSAISGDLRVIAGLIVLMILMLVAMYWLIGNTAFSDWILSLGRGIN